MSVSWISSKPFLSQESRKEFRFSKLTAAVLRGASRSTAFLSISMLSRPQEGHILANISLPEQKGGFKGKPEKLTTLKWGIVIMPQRLPKWKRNPMTDLQIALSDTAHLVSLEFRGNTSYHTSSTWRSRVLTLKCLQTQDWWLLVTAGWSGGIHSHRCSQKHKRWRAKPGLHLWLFPEISSVSLHKGRLGL